MGGHRGADGLEAPALDLRRLKRSVSIEHVLADRGLLAGMRRRGQLVGACPIHGGDNPDAFVVNPQRGLWRCYVPPVVM